jgi:hypothetical protein
MRLKQSPDKEKPRTNVFTAEFYQTFKELTSILLRLFHEIKRERTLPNSF